MNYFIYGLAIVMLPAIWLAETIAFVVDKIIDLFNND